MIIYGLKAYEDQSRRIEREYLRLKKFEQALHDGAVMERLVDAEDRQQLPAEEFEPRLRVGAEAGAEFYAPLLGGLQELHRYWQRRSWGLAFDTNEVEMVAGILERFAGKGILLEDRDPLLGVDRYSSTFEYRSSVNGKWRLTNGISSMTRPNPCRCTSDSTRNSYPVDLPCSIASASAARRYMRKALVRSSYGSESTRRANRFTHRAATRRTKPAR